MKRTCFIFLVILGGITNLISCRNDFQLQDYDTQSKESIAESYIMNLLYGDAICAGRCLGEEKYPAFFDEIEILDDDNQTISFSDFSEEEKEMFYEVWKEHETLLLLEKFEEDEDLAYFTYINNIAFDRALNRSSRNANTQCINIDSFVNNLCKEIEHIKRDFDKNEARLSSSTEKGTTSTSAGTSGTSSSSSSSNSSGSSSSSSSGSSGKKGKEIKRNNIVPSSVEKYKENYRRGNILICKDSSSSSSGSSFFGHAAIMSESKWNSIWDGNGLAPTSIGSWG